MNDEQTNLNPGDQSDPPILDALARLRKSADEEMIRRHRRDFTAAVIVCVIVCGLCILAIVAGSIL